MYRIAYHPIYKYPVPEHHRFPMDKYELLPIQLLREGIVLDSQFFEPNLCDLEHVYRVHDQDYIDRFVQLELTYHEGRRIGFEQTPILVERELRLVQGTIDGALAALSDGIAFNVAGGTHHACYAHGEGFCMINDQGVAAQYLIDSGSAKKVLIVDLDVHQGNGTADILGHSQDIFTWSVHCQSNYPFRKAKSHLDTGLEDGIMDDAYLNILYDTLYKLIKTVQPDFIFYQAGVDILATDKMGKFKITPEGCQQRDEIVMELANRKGIPIQCSMGGGYSKRLKDVIDAHRNTYLVANKFYA